MSTRREFLTAWRKPLEKELSKEEWVVRPPYALDESLFQKGCEACESKACQSSCEEEIIVIKSDGTPILNFTKSGCTFCEACAKACESGVLSLDHQVPEQVNARFEIGVEACVAHSGVICFACKEPCIDDAILFNGMFNPVIDMDRCTGCGFCLSRCPTKAISYEAKAIKEVS